MVLNTDPAFKNSLPVFAALFQLLPLAWPFYVLISALVGLEAALSLTQLHSLAVSPYPEMNTNVTISLPFRRYCKSVTGNSRRSKCSISSKKKEGVGGYILYRNF